MNNGIRRRCDQVRGSLLWAVVVTIVVGGGFIGLILFLAIRDPGEVRSLKMWEVDESVLMDQMALSVELEGRFEALWSVGEDDKVAFGVLERAIEAQKEVCELSRGHEFGARERLVSLEERLIETKGLSYSKQAHSLVLKAEPLMEAGRADEARGYIAEALRLRSWINEHLGDSPLADTKDEARLQQWLNGLETFDASEKVDLWVRKGRSALSLQSWDEARKWLGKALDLQEVINREVSHGNHARPVLAQQLREELHWMEAARMDYQVGRYLEKAKVATREGEPVLEYEALKNAMELQARINEEYRFSPYVSEQRLSELRDRLMKGKSLDLQSELDRCLKALDAALFERDWELAQERLEEAKGVLERFLGEYDKSFLDDRTVPVRLEWLEGRWDVLKGCVSELDTHLLAVPGKDGVNVLDRELPQKWYRAVEGENPSRHVGDNLPVESVSLSEAVAFCKKLSWAMGQKVRLPREEELTGFSFCEMDGGWFSHNSGFETHPVASLAVPSGSLPDLYGNVAEWLFESGEGHVYGGRGIDPAVVVRESPIEPMDENGRSRWVGFRVVVATKRAAE